MNFAKFLRILFLQNSSARLLLKAVLNCYEYFCDIGKKYGALNETAKALKLCNAPLKEVSREWR